MVWRPCSAGKITILPHLTSLPQPNCHRLNNHIPHPTSTADTLPHSLIGYAVGNIKSGLPRWMYIFLILGTCSITAGICALLFLPDLPSTAKFLHPNERITAVNRVASNRQGIKNHHFKRYQLIQTMRDPKTWILFIMATGAQIPNAALTSFASLIVKSFGFDTVGTQYMQIPGGAVQFFALLSGGWLCSHYKNIRFPTMIVANSICILGAALLVGLPQTNKWGRLVALWLCYFQGLGFSMSLTIVSSNIAGYTKKQLTSAILFTGYCVGNIIGPQTFKDSEAPGYKSAYVAMLIGYVVKLLAITVLYAYMWSVNKKRDREQRGESQTAVAAEDVDAKVRREGIEGGMLDQTELDNKAFRYVL